MLDSDTLKELIAMKVSSLQAGMRIPIRRMATLGMRKLTPAEKLERFMELNPNQRLALQSKWGEARFKRYVEEMERLGDAGT